jgi:hypothetical protein
MIQRLQAVVLTLTMLLPGSLVAQTATQTPCATVAQAILSIDPPGGWQSPVRALDKVSGGVVTVDAEGWRAETRQAGLDKLRELRATQPLRDAISKLTDDSGLFSLHRFGRSSLAMAEVIQGSLFCQYFVFFDSPATGASKMITEPPIAQSTNGPRFCWKSSAYAGAVAGMPAFIVADDEDNTVKLSITPWRDGQWQQACQVTIGFDPVFDVASRFCQGVDCAAFADRALAAVKRLDQGSAPSEDGTEAFKAMKQLAEDDPPGKQLPTFGGSIQGPYNEFAPESVMVPLIVGGQTYLGRIGHAAFAWRISPDYLVAAYRKQGNGLAPVAGFYISKTRGKPLSATVE